MNIQTGELVAEYSAVLCPNNYALLSVAIKFKYSITGICKAVKEF